MSAEFMTIYYSNGQKYTEGNWEDNIPIGDHIIWHETGGRKYQSIDFEDTPTMVTEWYENGQLSCTGVCKDFSKKSLWVFWDTQGDELCKCLYTTDEIRRLVN